MEGEGLLVLSQAQMDSVGTMEPTGHQELGVTFANEGQPPPSEQHSNGASGPVDPTTETHGSAGDTRTTTSLKARKRTKTGCLTCRKRRIKCGEERPTCSNCVKSKRNCEGYTPRVVFKDPLGSFRPTGGVSQQGHGLQYQHASRQNGAAGQYGRMQSTSNSQASLPAIRPRPRPSVHDGQTEPTSMAPTTIPDTYSSYGQNHHSKAYPLSDLPPRMRHLYNSQHSFTSSNQGMSDTEIRTPITSKTPFYHQHTSESDSGVDMGPSSLPSEWSHSFSTPYSYPKGYVRNDTRDTTLPLTHIPTSRHTEPMPYTQFPEAWGRGYDDSQSLSTGLSPFVDGQWSAMEPQPDEAFFPADTPFQSPGCQTWTINGGIPLHAPDPDGYNHIAPQVYQNYPQHHRIDLKAPTRYIQAFPMQPPVTVDDAEDDLFDVDSDRDVGSTASHLGDTPRSDLGLMLALAASQDDRSLRSITNFLDTPNVLATYQPTYTASPLMDPQTARVFCHFVTATAPSMSIFERHPTNPNVMFTGAPVPSSQQALWTYTLPMMALSHQGLLHSMLALASLHIAKLQQTSAAPSLKHYHFALRRVAKAVGLPSKRTGIATLAATLLLGFYEATTAEHNKWNSHLAGARQLVMEIDFAGTTKQIREQNAQAEANKYHSGFNGYQQPYSGRRFSDDVSLDLDNGLISTLMGWKSDSDQYGQILDPTAFTEPRRSPLTPKDIEIYQTQRDLFWCMPYERWDHCPPRAPVGRLDAVYGTMDHLVLLLGRIVDFGAKDQRRKSKAVEANGGQWRPPPGMFPSQPSGRPPQSGPPSQPQAPPTSLPNNSIPNGPIKVSVPAQGGPPMYGMIPSTGPIRIPTGFIQGPRDHILPTTITSEGIELEAATVAAEAEWNDLRNALEIFEESLGPDYQPLSPEHMQPLSTPFGPALYYRNYSISCVWTLFYMGRIIAARVHPSMPPAMMAAASIAAPRTAEWATLIGRICAGLQPVSTRNPLNPSLGAALVESTLALFFAAVQFRDAAQRGWTITKLRDIARLTGWQSSAAIAAGCETSWIRAYEAGRGPPYARTMEPTARDDRVAGRRPYTDGLAPKDSNDRRFITVNAGTRVHWALGLLSMEEDMRQLSVSKTG